MPEPKKGITQNISHDRIAPNEPVKNISFKSKKLILFILIFISPFIPKPIIFNLYFTLYSETDYPGFHHGQLYKESACDNKLERERESDSDAGKGAWPRWG